VDALRDGIEALCDDDCRRRLAAGVENRRASMPWNDTRQDLVDLVAGRLDAVRAA
jgi:hypothetical protein